MGRTRKLSPEQINQAIITLCNREGAANLTIDALAKEIGTTKSSVVYRSDKAEILENFIRSGIRHLGHRIKDCESAHAGAPYPSVHAALDLARRRSDFDLLAASLAIAVSLGPAETCRIEANAAIGRHIDRLRNGSGDHAKAMAALIGVMGLCFGETLGLLTLAEAEREAFLVTLAELGTPSPHDGQPPFATSPCPVANAARTLPPPTLSGAATRVATTA